jgi:hypothetical protein
MLLKDSDPINSGLWVAMAIVATCGFHGTPTTRHHAYRIPE